jgi:hypothetical protein
MWQRDERSTPSQRLPLL